MRIVSNGGKMFLILPDNNVCSFVGAQPAKPNPFLEDEKPVAARSGRSLIDACAAFARSFPKDFGLRK